MNITEARDEIFALLKSKWETAVWKGSATPPVIYWQGKEATKPPPQDQWYSAAGVFHKSGHQASLAGADGSRMYDRTGTVIVQCFGPSAGGNGLVLAEEQALIALNAFEGAHTANGIWFRNCSPYEVGVADGWYVIHVNAEFTYTEVK